MNPVNLDYETGHILYDGDIVGQMGSDFFEPFAWARRGGLEGSAMGRGAAFFLSEGEREYVLRHYRRGGFAARFSEDRYLWLGLERSRPVREWRLLARLVALGLPVPAPVAARVVRHGLFYSGDLVTLRLHARSFASLVTEGADRSVWERVGGCIRRFHDAGACHADLNVRNILMDDAGKVWLIDFDRGSLREPGRWREANLARLRRSLEKLARLESVPFDEGLWGALRSGYKDRRGDRL